MMIFLMEGSIAQAASVILVILVVPFEVFFFGLLKTRRKMKLKTTTKY